MSQADAKWCNIPDHPSGEHFCPPQRGKRLDVPPAAFGGPSYYASATGPPSPKEGPGT